MSESRSRKGEKTAVATIAWARWRVTVPEEWRPLKIQGDPVKGSMMIGDAERPIVLIQWCRQPKAGFDTDKWFEQRFRKLGTVPARGAPVPERFTKTAWQPELSTHEGTSKTLWCGYSADACLIVEVIVTTLTEPRLRNWIFEKMMPGMKVSSEDEPCCWSMYAVGFRSPPGFELKQKHLYSGDVALLFEREDKGSLLLRQVYPAKLAMSRRTFERWLEATPFLERRKLRNPVRTAWTGHGPHDLEGIRLAGWKRLPAPLGRCGPRHVTAVAAVDLELDRLLIAELQTPGAQGGVEAESAVEHMNRA